MSNVQTDVPSAATPCGATVEAWRRKRLSGKRVRRHFTDCLQEHGVVADADFAACTNEAYRGLMGFDAKGWRARKGLAKKASLRDSLTIRELAFVEATEALAVDRIEETEACGPAPCRAESYLAGLSMRRALEWDRARRTKYAPPANENRVRSDDAA